MSGFQAMMLLAMAFAFAAGQPARLICIVMMGNFLFSTVFHDQTMLVAMFDLVAACALIGSSGRGQIVALLFFVMATVYPIAAWRGWPIDATYAIVECIGYVQLGVIGGLDRGVSRTCRDIAGRLYRRWILPAHWGNAQDGLARIAQKDRQVSRAR